MAGTAGTSMARTPGRWRVASYARLSREDRVRGESDSIRGQRRMIEQWAEAQGGVDIVASYADDGWSGATFERPGFRRMMDDARRGLFDTIVVKDLSRFGRSYLDCGGWVERLLPKLGVRLYSIGDGFDSMAIWDCNMALLFPMKNLMNEMHVVATSEKVRASLAAKRDRGECVANFAPFGYRKDPDDAHRLTADKEAAAVVRRIFALYADGMSAAGIARELNAEQVPSPAAWKQRAASGYATCFGGAGAPAWHAKSVLRVVDNEVHAGTLVQGRTRRPNWRLHEPCPVPPERWHRTEGAHEAIVDRDLFERAARRREEERRRRDGRGRPAEADGGIRGEGIQVICACCGGGMRLSTMSSKGKRYTYYVCAARRRDTRACTARSVRAEAVDQAIRNALEREGWCGTGNARVEVRAEPGGACQVNVIRE